MTMVQTIERTAAVFDHLRSWIAACQEVDRWQQIDGADWDLEIGALTEATAERTPGPPFLLSKTAKGSPAGSRGGSLLSASSRRSALALGLPLDHSKLEL